MEWLFLATGVTGALTLLFLWRCLYRRFNPPLSLSATFSPADGGAELVVQHIRRARQEVLLRFATFTSKAIAEALVDAKTRGLNVDIVLDRSGESEAEGEAAELLGEGITPLIDTDHPTGTTKVVLLDGKTVITGSFTLTPSEVPGAQHILVIGSHTEIARGFRQAFLDQKANAKPVERKKGKPSAPKSEPKQAA